MNQAMMSHPYRSDCPCDDCDDCRWLQIRRVGNCHGSAESVSASISGPAMSITATTPGDQLAAMVFDYLADPHNPNAVDPHVFVAAGLAVTEGPRQSIELALCAAEYGAFPTPDDSDDMFAIPNNLARLAHASRVYEESKL